MWQNPEVTWQAGQPSLMSYFVGVNIVHDTFFRLVEYYYHRRRYNIEIITNFSCAFQHFFKKLYWKEKLSLFVLKSRLLWIFRSNQSPFVGPRSADGWLRLQLFKNRQILLKLDSKDLKSRNFSLYKHSKKRPNYSRFVTISLFF